MAEYNIEKNKVVYGQWICFKNICPKCFSPVSNNYCNDCKIEIEIKEMPENLKDNLKVRKETINAILCYRKKLIKDKINSIMALNTNIDIDIIDFVNDEMKEMIFYNQFKDLQGLRIDNLFMEYRSIEYNIKMKEKTFFIKMEIGSDRYTSAYSIRYKGNEYYPERENNTNFQAFIDQLDYFYNFLSRTIKDCNEIIYKKKIDHEMKIIEELLKWEDL